MKNKQKENWVALMNSINESIEALDSSDAKYSLEWHELHKTTLTEMLKLIEFLAEENKHLRNHQTLN